MGVVRIHPPQPTPTRRIRTRRSPPAKRAELGRTSAAAILLQLRPLVNGRRTPTPLTLSCARVARRWILGSGAAIDSCGARSDG